MVHLIWLIISPHTHTHTLMLAICSQTRSPLIHVTFALTRRASASRRDDSDLSTSGRHWSGRLEFQNYCLFDLRQKPRLPVLKTSLWMFERSILPFPCRPPVTGESRCRFPFASPAGDANFREIRHVNADGFPQVFSLSLLFFVSFFGNPN